MPKPNDELLNRVLEGESPSLSPEQRFRESVARWFEGRKNLYTVWSTLVALAGIALLFRGGTVLYTGLLADRTDLIANGSFLAILGFAFLFFDKVWYRIANSAAIMLQQLLLLRSEISRLHGRQSEDSPEAGASVGPAELLPGAFRGRFAMLWGAVKSRTVEWISTIVVIGGAVVAGLTLTGSLLDHPDIAQVDEWRITADDTVAATSRIRFERPPAGGHFVTVALPYPTAEITSVTADGRALRFSKLDWRRYEVEMPIGSFPWQPPEIVVAWEFPLENLAPVDGGYRTTLAPLLPVSYYRLEVVVDEESGYQVAGKPENRRLVPFYSGTVFDQTFFGSCTIGVEKQS